MDYPMIPGTDCSMPTELENPLDVLKRGMLEFVIVGADKLLIDQNIGMKKYSAASALSDDVPRYPVSDGNDSKEENEDCFVQENHRTCTLKDCAHSVQLDNLACDDYTSILEEKYAPDSKSFSELPLNLLAFLAVLLMKMFGFHLNLLVSLSTFPIRLSYISFMLVIFRLRTLRQVKRCLMMKLWRISSVASSRTSDKLITHKRSVVRIGQGIFRSICAFFILVVLLSLGFVLGSLAKGYLIEKPVHLTESLNFDYTKPSPVAFVPIMSSVLNQVHRSNIGPRVIPYNHKLELTVSLTLPETEYNKKLGVFQVRVEFLSAKGEVTASSSHPCMLRFKSQPIHYIETFLKSAPLIAGLRLESQTLNIKMTEFTEGIAPTACLRVTLEPRAEYKPAGAGVPETYAASLELQSHLPRAKKIIWQWRRTLLVWVSFYAFIIELVFMLALLKVIYNRFKNSKGGSW